MTEFELVAALRGGIGKSGREFVLHFCPVQRSKHVSMNAFITAETLPHDFRAQLRRFIPGQVPATGSATTLAPVRAMRLRVSPVDRAVVEADRVGEVLAVT